MKPLQELVRDEVAPLLRALGFKRSSGTFRATTDKGVATISVSGRGGIGQTDIDCRVDASLSIDGRPDIWSAPVRDPGLTPMDANDKWRFNQDDDAMLSLFRTVLTMAAEDLLHRLATWPAEPKDSLSRRPTFRVPVEWETRSRWHSNAAGQFDLHYAASSPVVARQGLVGATPFDFEVVPDELCVMISLGPDARALLTDGRPFAAWAEGIGLRSLAGHAALPRTPSPPGVELHLVGPEADLVVAGGTSHPAVRFSLGELPLALHHDLRRLNLLQVVVIDGRDDPLQKLTWRSRMQLAEQGRVWWSTVELQGELQGRE